MNTHTNLRELALAYHQRMPADLYQHLNSLGVPEPLVHRYRLGWDGRHITIPISNRDREVVFFKLLPYPQEGANCEATASSSMSQIELYGWERVLHKRDEITICASELDRLILEAHGFPAVCSTGGVGVFRRQWLGYFVGVPRVLICFNGDAAGVHAARRLKEQLPGARVLDLPRDARSVSEFFVRRGRSHNDFRLLIEPRAGQPQLVGGVEDAESKDIEHTVETVDDLKAKVPLERLVARYVRLHRKGERLLGRCPFHSDDDESFAVQPKTQSFECAGCGAYGDAITFIMRAERLGFPEALAEIANLVDQQ